MVNAGRWRRAEPVLRAVVAAVAVSSRRCMLTAMTTSRFLLRPAISLRVWVRAREQEGAHPLGMSAHGHGQRRAVAASRTSAMRSGGGHCCFKPPMHAHGDDHVALVGGSGGCCRPVGPSQ